MAVVTPQMNIPGLRIWKIQLIGVGDTSAAVWVGEADSLYYQMTGTFDGTTLQFQGAFTADLAEAQWHVLGNSTAVTTVKANTNPVWARFVTSGGTNPNITLWLVAKNFR